MMIIKLSPCIKILKIGASVKSFDKTRYINSSIENEEFFKKIK